MKKVNILLLIMAIAFGSLSFAQESKIDQLLEEPSETEVERIIDKYGSKAIEAFNNAVEKIAPVAESGFEMVVRLQIAKGIVYMMPSIIFLIILIAFIKKYNYTARHTDSDYPVITFFTSDGIALILLLCFGIGFLVAASQTFYSGLTHIIAPEWYAVADILNLFK